MATRSYTSRRELETYHFSPVAAVAVPLAFLLLQAYLPKVFPRLLLVDLPLIAVIFFAVARRSPIAGTITGTVIGLLQDALTDQPLGINGIVKGIVGYFASNIGLQVDVENVVTRIVLNFGFACLQSLLLFLIQRFLLGVQSTQLLWVHEVIRASLNTAVAVPLFFILDRFKLRE